MQENILGHLPDWSLKCRFHCLLHCWWECKLIQPLWRTVWSFLKKLKIELPYDPAIPFLGIYPDKTLIQKDTNIPMFIAALFTIHGNNLNVHWQMNGQRRCDIYIYNGILLRHKKEWNNAICSNMDATRDYHTKWSKSERQRRIPYDITYMWNLKYDTNELIYKTETDSQT